MNVSATHGPTFAAANARPPSATPPAADPPATDPAPAPAPATSHDSEPPVTEPVEHKAHGHAAADSHRNGVAALRQWINHPSRRAELGTPDLTAPHHGKGFEQAVAAYQAAAGPPATTAPPTSPPAPTTEPVPVEGG